MMFRSGATATIASIMIVGGITQTRPSASAQMASGWDGRKPSINNLSTRMASPLRQFSSFPNTLFAH